LTSDRICSIPPPSCITDPEHNDQASGFENASTIFIHIGKDTKQNVFDPLEEFYPEARELTENKVNEVKSRSIILVADGFDYIVLWR